MAGQMPPPIDTAIFTLGKGAVSEPIDTPGGFQIFKVDDLREEKTLSLKEATPEIAKILRTEKGARGSAADNKYYFDVALDANKLEIKYAVEKLYKVKVTKVNTLVVGGKPKTIRAIEGYRPDRKKAIVTLADGQTIDMTV